MTYFSKLFSKNNRHLVVGATVGTIAIGLRILPHTIFLEDYKDLVSLRRLVGTLVTPTEEIEERFQEVLNDLALPEDKRKILRPFTVFGYYAVHGGTFYKPYGGVVGIPENYHFHKPSDIRQIDWVIDFQKTTWVDADAERMKASLILSKEAQKFGIAREILKIQTNEPIVGTIALAIIVPVVLAAYHIVHKRFSLNEKKRLWRMGVQTGFILLALTLKLVVLSNYIYINDLQIDKTLAELGPEYINGGIEFYQKLIYGNISLRNQLEERGKRRYTDDGDEKCIYICKEPPLTKKKSFFEERLSDLHQAT